MKNRLEKEVEKILIDAIESQIDWDSYYAANTNPYLDQLLTLFEENFWERVVKMTDKEIVEDYISAYKKSVREKIEKYFIKLFKKVEMSGPGLRFSAQIRDDIISIIKEEE